MISGEHNDTRGPAAANGPTRSKIDARIERFKKPLFADGPNTLEHEQGRPAGVPDRQVDAAHRLRRPGGAGDVPGPAHQGGRAAPGHRPGQPHLRPRRRREGLRHRGGLLRRRPAPKEALAAYSAEDVEGALESLKDEIPKLRDQHRRVLDLFHSRGIEDIADTEALRPAAADERLRAEFQVKLKQFLATLDLVLPRPEGLPFVNDAKTLAYIQARARNRYRGDERLIGKEVGEKVRKLIDEHIISLGIDPKIPPIEITDADFDEHVEQERSPRAKASEMEHALRYHIRKHLDEDPTHYEKLSERLKGILQEFEGRWDELAEALKRLIEEARRAARGRRDRPRPRDPGTVLRPAAAGDRRRCHADGQDARRGSAPSPWSWWTTSSRRSASWASGIPTGPRPAMGCGAGSSRPWMTADLLPFDRLEPVADRLMELAKANHHRLVR